MRARRLLGWTALVAVGLVGVLAVMPKPPKSITRTEPAQKPVPIKVERSTISGLGVLYTLTSTTSGKVAEATLSCGERRDRRSVAFRVGIAPTTPPPLHGAIGRLTIDGGPEREIELGWGTGDVWIPRDESAQPSLVHDLATAATIRFIPPSGYYAGTPITWTTPADTDAKAMRATCSG